MPDIRRPAQVFSPLEYLLEEIEARPGWTLSSMARFCRQTPQVFERRMETGDVDEALAKRIAQAFGTSPQLWINLGAQYRQWNKEHAA